MPHGGEQLPYDLANVKSELLLGPTLDVLAVKPNEYDRGELRFAICAAPKEKRVLINFGIPIAWAAVTYDEAVQMSEILRDKAESLLNTESAP